VVSIEFLWGRDESIEKGTEKKEGGDDGSSSKLEGIVYLFVAKKGVKRGKESGWITCGALFHGKALAYSKGSNRRVSKG